MQAGNPNEKVLPYMVPNMGLEYPNIGSEKGRKYSGQGDMWLPSLSGVVVHGIQMHGCQPLLVGLSQSPAQNHMVDGLAL